MFCTSSDAHRARNLPLRLANQKRGADGQGWVERPSERIAHCAEHTREWVRAAGLEMRSVREVTVRMGGDSVNGPTGEIRGHLCLVSKGAAAWRPRLEMAAD